MKVISFYIFLSLTAFSVFSRDLQNKVNGDTSEVIKLDKLGYLMRLTDPAETFKDARKALDLAKQINYIAGIGESYRVMGIGNYYLDQSKEAIDNYLAALGYFEQINDLKSEAKVYNNIGNLYSNNDNDEALDFFQKSLNIAQKLNDRHLVAVLNMNLGNVYYHKKAFYRALNFYSQSNSMFTGLKDSVFLTQCMQNTGVAYFNLKLYDKAKDLLLEANKRAKQLDLNESIASIDITLAELYIAQKDFNQAKKTIEEGLNFSTIVKGEKMQADFKYISYELEFRRKNFANALSYLYDIYHQDSVKHESGNSAQINLIREQVTAQAKQRENQFLIEKQENDRLKFLGAILVSGLLLICTVLLVNNIKRKTKTNEQLNDLNHEVSRQKDNLDRINHHLEEIIDERTRELQQKNKKLSDHSSYLSHQIRGPVATLKGLMNLEKEGLVDQEECIKLMDKCVSDIDEKIIEMSNLLHDSSKFGY